MSVRRSALLATALMLALIGGACQRVSRAQADARPGVRVELEAQPSPASVGESELLVSLANEAGEPISGAALSARGDMTHAGMTPVFGESAESEPGRYRIPFEWTMGGDWIVTIQAELPSGDSIERQFDVRVASEGS